MLSLRELKKAGLAKSGMSHSFGKDLPRRIVRTGILKSIDEKNNVEIYTLPIDEKKRFFLRKGLPVDYLVGLEAGLIEHLGSEHWNPSGSAGKAKRAKVRRDL